MSVCVYKIKHVLLSVPLIVLLLCTKVTVMCLLSIGV